MMTQNQLGNYLRRTRYFLMDFKAGDFMSMMVRENLEIIDKIIEYFLDKEGQNLDYREIDLLDNLLTMADIVYRQGRKTLMTDETYDKLEQLGLKNNIKEKMSSEAVISSPKLREVVTKYDLLSNPIITLDKFRDDKRMTETLHDYTQLQGTIQKVKAITKDEKYNSIEWFFDNMGIKNDDNEYIILCSRKYDGNSVTATIRDGRVTKAVTRGVDGKGKDLTEYMSHLYYPELPDMGVAFECILKESSLLELRHTKGATYKNCRSGLQGILGDLDGVQYKELLTFVPLKSSNMFTLRFEEIKLLNRICGEDVGMYYYTIKGTRDELMSTLKGIIESESRNRCNLGYLIDGLVLEYLGYLDIDKKYIDTRMDIGRDINRRINKWECAYKFESEEAETRLIDVKYTVGRTGKITPMAYFEDIQFSNGNEYTKASLGSIRRMTKELDLHAEDKIVIQYSNDVIPYVSRVVLREHAVRSRTKIVPPTVCPVCGIKLKEHNDELKCINPKCAAKVVLAIPKALKLLGAKNISDKTVELLYNEGILTKFEDIFTLHEKQEELLKIKGIGEKKVAMILNEIELIKSTPIPPHILMASLGLESAGRRVFEKILAEIGHVELMSRIEFLWDTFYEMITGDYELLNHETGYTIIEDENVRMDSNYKKALKFIRANIIGLGMSEEDERLFNVILDKYTMDDIITNVLGMASQVMKFSVKYGLLNKYVTEVRTGAETFDSLKDDLTKIEGIGEISAIDLISYMTPDKIEQYKTCCTVLKVEETVVTSNTKDAKFKVVLSGFRDKDNTIADRLALVGAVLVDNMSADVDLLIVDDRTKTTSKTKKAEKFKTPVLDTNDFTSISIEYLLELLTKGNADELIM